MNLNEDKKAPLREKDFSIKKEMVMQYINTASKTVSKTVKWGDMQNKRLCEKRRVCHNHEALTMWPESGLWDANVKAHGLE